jgi:parvulin-like peptidyl-prolyl isomerase
MQRLIAPLAVALAVVGTILTGCGGETPVVNTPSATVSAGGELAALVNGEPISMEYYQRQVAQVEAFFEEEGLDPESAEGQERLAQVRRQVLEQMVDQELIRQAAAEMGIAISDQELEVKIQEIVQQSGGQDEFESALQDTGTSYDDFKQMLLDQLLSDAVFNAVTGSISRVATQVHARHILLPTREQAEEVLTRLQGGEDFAFLAREYSEDVSSRERGGDMGFFPEGVMPPELEEVAFSLDPGQISEIVESQFGFHIVQVLEKEEREISAETFEDLRQQAFMQWLQERREGASIERFVE